MRPSDFTPVPDSSSQFKFSVQELASKVDAFFCAKGCGTRRADRVVRCANSVLPRLRLSVGAFARKS